MRILLAILLLIGARAFAASPLFLGATTDYITNSGGTITFVYSNRAVVIATRGSGAVAYQGSLSTKAFTGSTNDPLVVRNTNGAPWVRVDTNGLIVAEVKSAFGTADPVLRSGSGGNGFEILNGFSSAFRNFGLRRPDGSPMLALDLTYLELSGGVAVGSSFAGVDAILTRHGAGTNGLAGASGVSGTGSLLASNLIARGVLVFGTNTVITPPSLALGSFGFWNSNGLALWKVWNTNGTTAALLLP